MLKNSPTKILLFAKTLDSGTGVFVRNLHEIKNKSLSILTISLEKPLFSNYPLPLKCFNSRDYTLTKYSLSIGQFIKLFGQFLWLRKEINRFNPDIVLSVDVNANILTGMVKLLFHKKYKMIFTTHVDLKGTLEEKASPFVGFILRLLITFFYNHADELIAISTELAASVKTFFKIKKPVQTIFYGIKITSSKARKKPLNKNLVILTACRLDTPKDLPTLIEGFGKFVNKYKNAKLLIAGDGPQKKQIQSLVKRKGLNSQVTFLGWVLDINKILRKTDIFVLSTKREGFALVLLEAMSHGIPVMATDVDFGPREILDYGKFGILVEKENSHQIFHNLDLIFHDKEKYSYLSNKSIDRAQQFKLSLMQQKYQELFKKIL